MLFGLAEWYKIPKLNFQKWCNFKWYKKRLKHCTHFGDSYLDHFSLPHFVVSIQGRYNWPCGDSNSQFTVQYFKQPCGGLRNEGALALTLHLFLFVYIVCIPMMVSTRVSLWWPFSNVSSRFVVVWEVSGKTISCGDLLFVSTRICVAIRIVVCSNLSP